jgi:hypothetical protein
MAATEYRDFSLVIGGTTPAAQIGDMLTTLWDPCVILHKHDSIAPALEEETGRLLLDLFALERDSFVPSFTSGATAAKTGCASRVSSWASMRPRRSRAGSMAQM